MAHTTGCDTKEENVDSARVRECEGLEITTRFLLWKFIEVKFATEFDYAYDENFLISRLYLMKKETAKKINLFHPNSVAFCIIFFCYF